MIGGTGANGGIVSDMDRTARWIAQIAIVAGSGAGMYFSIGIVLIYGFSVFIVPIAEDTGWDRTAVAAVVAPIAIVNGLMSPVIGALTDRFGPRRVLTASSVLMAGSVISILPMFALYVFAQKYIVQGVAGTGLK